MARKKKSKARYGSGQIVEPRTPGGTWAIKWYDEHGKRRWQGKFASREVAEAALAAILNNVKSAATDRAADDSAPLGELMDKWIAERMANQEIHRSARDEKNRWNAYLKKALSHIKPREVTAKHLMQVVVELRKTVAANTAMNALRVLSSFYSDHIEDRSYNPVAMISKKFRAKYLTTDQVDEPFVEKADDVARIFQHLHYNQERPDIAFAYAVGALAGLRTGEVLGLEAADFEFERGIIKVRRQVRHGKVGPLKDGDEREVGIQDALLPILKNYWEHQGGKGILLRPTFIGRGGTKKQPARYLASGTLNEYLAVALEKLGINSDLTWYNATRHTFASHWMINGGDLAKLQNEMGHSDIKTTMRYAKLSPEFRTAKDRALLSLPMRSGAIGSTIGSNEAQAPTEMQRNAANR